LSAVLLLGGVVTGWAQAPAEPPASRTTEVAFTSHDGHEMLGKLTLPAGPGPHPVVVYVQTAEGMTVDMTRPDGRGGTFSYFDLYAQRLPPMNVGFFRYEGRGVRLGAAPPRYERIDWEVYNTSTLENKVRDAMTALAVARKQAGVDSARILLMGTSEGTLLAAEAASRMPGQVSGLVLYAVMAENMRDVFRFIITEGAFLPYRRAFDTDSNGQVSRAEYEADPRRYRERVLRNAPFEALDRSGDSVLSVEDITLLTARLGDALTKSDFASLDQWAKTSAAVSTPANWFKDHFAHATIWTFLSRVDIPVGIFHGEADVNTSVAGVRRLEEQARAAGKTKMRFAYFPNADHSLNLGLYFARGELPPGHQAIFAFLENQVGVRR
jgi:hypothetical protein